METSHLVQMSYRSYKNNTYLLEAKQQPMCYACQTKYTVKHILIECTDLAHIRETFYSANNMKERFQNIEIKNVMLFLKAMNIYGKIYKKFQQDQISSTICSSTRNTSIKSDPFHKLFKKNPFYSKTNEISVKPDSFYKPFPYE